MTSNSDRLLRSDHRRLVRALSLTVVAAPTPPDLGTALAALPPQRRLAVVLHYALDVPVSGVAECLGIGRGAVRVHLHRARQVLARNHATLRDQLQALVAD